MLLLTLDRHAAAPVYRQLIDQIRFQASSGALAVGDEVPSTRSLALEHGLNPMTVSKAYAELERLGVLERRPGRASVIAERPAGDLIRERQQELERVLGSAVLAAQQLGIEPDQAAQIFVRLLEEAGSPECTESHGPAPDQRADGSSSDS